MLAFDRETVPDNTAVAMQLHGLGMRRIDVVGSKRELWENVSYRVTLEGEPIDFRLGKQLAVQFEKSVIGKHPKFPVNFSVKRKRYKHSPPWETKYSFRKLRG